MEKTLGAMNKARKRFLFSSCITFFLFCASSVNPAKPLLYSFFLGCLAVYCFALEMALQATILACKIFGAWGWLLATVYGVFFGSLCIGVRRLESITKAGLVPTEYDLDLALFGLFGTLVFLLGTIPLTFMLNTRVRGIAKDSEIG